MVAFACDPSLDAHIATNSVSKGTSNWIQNEILKSILCVSKEIIKDKINHLDYLPIMCDETDICHKSQMVVAARNEFEGKPIERFSLLLILQT